VTGNADWRVGLENSPMCKGKNADKALKTRGGKEKLMINKGRGASSSNFYSKITRKSWKRRRPGEGLVTKKRGKTR